MRAPIVTFPFSFAILGALFAGLVFAGFVTGIILLIIGLAKHRRGLWVGGLVVLLIALGIAAALVVVGGLFFFTGRTVSRSASGPRGVYVRQAQPASTGYPGELADLVTVFALGADAVAPIVQSTPYYSERTDGSGVKGRMVVETGPEIDPTFEQYFKRVEWDQVQEMMTHAHTRGGGAGNWDTGVLSKAECYLRTTTDQQGRQVTVAVCYDRKAKRLYCAWTRSPQ